MNKNTEKPVIEVKKARENPIPYLITRMGAGLLDMVMIILVFLLIQVGSFHTIYHPLGYHNALRNARSVLANSGLYEVGEDNSYKSIVEVYNGETDIDNYFDPPLTNFFLTNERALDTDLYQKYTEAKTNSGLFMIDGNGDIVVKNSEDIENLLTFYTIQTTTAIKFVENDPLYIANSKQVFLITVFTYLIGGTFALLIFYLFIPLLTKDKATLSQRLFKIGLVDVKTNTKATKNQLLLRFTTLLLINMWMPLLIYARFNYFTYIPILITLVLIVITRKNQSVHCFLSSTRLVSTRDLIIPKRETIDAQNNTAQGT